MRRFNFIAFFIALSNSIYGSIIDVKFTELMYHATNEGAISGSDLEFIEIKNTGSSVVDLSDVVIGGGIYYKFPSSTFIHSNEISILASDTMQFVTRYSAIAPVGEYNGGLKNSGETVYLITGLDTIAELSFNDNVPWPILADGNGYSLVPTQTNPVGSQDHHSKWRASSKINGSPGFDDIAVTQFPDVFINECLTHTDLPQIDAVEIYNAMDTSVDISYWFLSDNRNQVDKYQFAEGTIIQPGEYLVVDETDFNPFNAGFRFDRSGDEVYLVSSDSARSLTGFAQGWEFEGQYNGTSFGVYTNSVGERHFVAQRNTSLGAENIGPNIGPLVISAVNYNPDITQEEYIVIQNISDTLVELWEPGIPDSTWGVSGVKFQFPTGIVVQPYEEIILCSISTSNFKVKYDIDDQNQVFQYSEKLSNSGESITIYSLLRSDTIDSRVFMPHVIIDEVEYSNSPPWPLSADGHGYILKRIKKEEYGNDPNNWGGDSDIPFSIEEEKIMLGNLFPNPATSLLFVEFPSTENGTYSIISVDGKRINQTDFSANKIMIDCGDLNEGIYFLELETSIGIQVKQFAVLK